MAKTLATVPKKVTVVVPDTIAVQLDTQTKRTWQSKEGGKAFIGTEADLVRKACELLGYTPETLAHDSLITNARRRLSNATSGKSGLGVEGAADERILIAYNKMVREGEPAERITPSRLMTRCDPPVTNARTTQRWLERRALGSSPPAALAAIANAPKARKPGPKPKPPAKKKRTVAK